jgi:hypothetical protein
MGNVDGENEHEKKKQTRINFLFKVFPLFFIKLFIWNLLIFFMQTSLKEIESGKAHFPLNFIVIIKNC